jgi:hypothetical protein
VFGRYDLRLSEQEFWVLTPGQFDLLAKRHIEQRKSEIYLEQTKIKRSDQQAALICCVLANINRDKKKKPTPYKVDDFMPVEIGKKKKQTAQEQFQIVKMLNAAFGGAVT